MRHFSWIFPQCVFVFLISSLNKEGELTTKCNVLSGILAAFLWCCVTGVTISCIMEKACIHNFDLLSLIM